MQWVLQPEVTREQVVLLLEQSLRAILRATTSMLPPVAQEESPTASGSEVSEVAGPGRGL
jgi:hypothetical protein